MARLARPALRRHEHQAAPRQPMQPSLIVREELVLVELLQLKLRVYRSGGKVLANGLQGEGKNKYLAVITVRFSSLTLLRTAAAPL